MLIHSSTLAALVLVFAAITSITFTVIGFKSKKIRYKFTALVSGLTFIAISIWLIFSSAFIIIDRFIIQGFFDGFGPVQEAHSIIDVSYPNLSSSAIALTQTMRYRQDQRLSAISGGNDMPIAFVLNAYKIDAHQGTSHLLATHTIDAKEYGITSINSKEARFKLGYCEKDQQYYLKALDDYFIFNQKNSFSRLEPDTAKYITFIKNCANKLRSEKDHFDNPFDDYIIFKISNYSVAVKYYWLDPFRTLFTLNHRTGELQATIRDEEEQNRITNDFNSRKKYIMNTVSNKMDQEKYDEAFMIANYFSASNDNDILVLLDDLRTKRDTQVILQKINKINHDKFELGDKLYQQLIKLYPDNVEYQTQYQKALDYAGQRKDYWAIQKSKRKQDKIIIGEFNSKFSNADGSIPKLTQFIKSYLQEPEKLSHHNTRIRTEKVGVSFGAYYNLETSDDTVINIISHGFMGNNGELSDVRIQEIVTKGKNKTSRYLKTPESWKNMRGPDAIHQ